MVRFLVNWASCVRFLALIISWKFRVRAPMRLLEGVLDSVGCLRAALLGRVKARNHRVVKVGMVQV